MSQPELETKHPSEPSKDQAPHDGNPPAPTAPPPASPPPPANVNVEPKSSPYIAFAVVPLGHDDLWELRQIEIDGDKATIIKKGVPDVRQICTARAIAGIEGLDAFDRGVSVP